MTQTSSKHSDATYMSASEYLQQRVDHQLLWYSKKSAKNKKWYYRLQLITLVSAVAVPIISLSSGDFWVRCVVAIFGAVAAFAAGILSIYQLKDQWLDYRATAESLKFEKHLFMTQSSPYDKADAFSMFVQQVETIILSENRNWQQKSFDLPKQHTDELTTDNTVISSENSLQNVEQRP